MNKLRIGITAIALLLGVASAFQTSANARVFTFWTLIGPHTRVGFATAVKLCPGGLAVCAIQYTMLTNARTGLVRYYIPML